MTTDAMTTAASPPASAVADGPPIPARWIDEGNEVLHELQQILGDLARDERRKSPEFQAILGQYKALGTTLHEVRHRVATRPVTALGMKPGPAASRTGPLLDPGVTALGRLAQAKARPTPPAAAAQPTSVGNAAPVEPMAPARPDADAAAGPAPAAPAPEAVVEPEPVFPRHLRQFACTLGPPGSRAICRGPEVSGLQRVLVYMKFDVEVTATYDAKTYRAVQEFQKEHQIPVNGLVGAEVRRLLNQMITDQEGA